MPGSCVQKQCSVWHSSAAFELHSALCMSRSPCAAPTAANSSAATTTKGAAVRRAISSSAQVARQGAGQSNAGRSSSSSARTHLPGDDCLHKTLDEGASCFPSPQRKHWGLSGAPKTPNSGQGIGNGCRVTTCDSDAPCLRSTTRITVHRGRAACLAPDPVCTAEVHRVHRDLRRCTAAL